MIHHNNFVQNIHQIASRVVDRQLKPKIGYVTSYDPKTHAVRVRLEPESTVNEVAGETHPVVETNWLPLSRPFGGNGWGFIAPPKANPSPPYGDMVLVLWPDGGHGIALGPFYTDKERPFDGPLNGEFYFLHKDGAFIKMLNDGSVLIQAKQGNILRLEADGSVRMQGKSGAYVNLSSSSAASIGTTGADDKAVVTKKDLQFVLDQINTTFAARQSGSSSNPLIQAVASTSVTVTD